MKIFKTSILLAFLFFLASNAYSQTTHIVEASGFVFNPSDLTIINGDTVKWVWISETHTTTSDNPGGFEHWDAPLDQNHLNFSIVFTHDGTFTYHCTFHVSLGMIGKITVQEPTSILFNNSVPNNFDLEQNYPNPFNPSTTINYAVPTAGLVTIKVFDILGKEIAALVNERKTAGNYAVDFNAINLPSGVYFYRMQAGSFASTKKFVLLK
jgi:plastocyanin